MYSKSYIRTSITNKSRVWLKDSSRPMDRPKYCCTSFLHMWIYSSRYRPASHWTDCGIHPGASGELCVLIKQNDANHLSKVSGFMTGSGQHDSIVETLVTDVPQPSPLQLDRFLDYLAYHLTSTREPRRIKSSSTL
jgi:hypothetical protein